MDISADVQLHLEYFFFGKQPTQKHIYEDLVLKQIII